MPITFRRRNPLRDNGGVAMIEFTLALPFLVVTHLGGSYFADMNMANNKVTRAAQTLVNLVAQDPELTTAEVTSILNASRAVLDPIGSSSSLTITSVRYMGGGFSTRWSDAIGSTPARAYATPYPMDAGALAAFRDIPATRGMLIADVRVNYSSGLARMWNSLAWMPFQVPGTAVLSDRAYAFPTTVATSGSPLNGTQSDATVRIFDTPTGGPLGTGKVW